MPNYRDPSDENLYPVHKVQTCSGRPLEVTTVSGYPVKITSAGTTASDAFGRLRTSDPITLFDSSHRYNDNGSWNTSTGVSGAATFNSNQGLVDLTVGTVSGSKTYRETNRVFSYQPGKSLLAMNTFVFSSGQANLRQRVGYFSSGNGIYLQLSGTNLSLVERTSVSGSITETIIPQSGWNIDPLDGTGPSAITIDKTKSQILWMDIEWLGVGSVRTGFVIDGVFVQAHTFHHANLFNTTYITTASLPIRYEIETLNTTASSGTLKQICSTVISEGGYQLQGAAYSINTALDSARVFSASGTFYPVVSLRLKTSPDRMDAVVIPTAVNLFGQGNNAVFNWRLIAAGTTSGGTWTGVSSASNVEYNLSGTSISGGRVLAQGFIGSTTQASTTLQLPKDSLFKYQLQRNTFNNTPEELIFAVASKADNDTAYASVDWEEVTK